MFEVLDEVCQPKKATKYSACVDLFAREDVTIGAGETKIVPLGVKIDLKLLAKQVQKNNELITWVLDFENKRGEFFNTFLKSHKLDIHIRSSLSAKKRLIIANGTGQIDLDYPDEIGIILHNPIQNFSATLTSNHLDYISIDTEVDIDTYVGNTAYIQKGDKVAQITLIEHKSYLMGYESEEERIGGYGSTGE